MNAVEVARAETVLERVEKVVAQKAAAEQELRGAMASQSSSKVAQLRAAVASAKVVTRLRRSMSLQDLIERAEVAQQTEETLEQVRGARHRELAWQFRQQFQSWRSRIKRGPQ